MGSNFHTPWVDGSTLWKASSVNPLFAELDRALTYLKNVMVAPYGRVYAYPNTGMLVWSDVIRIRFFTAAGASVYNYIAAGNITLAVGYYAYVTLNEADGTLLTVSQAIVSGTSHLPYNVLVLAVRASGGHQKIWPIALSPIEEMAYALTSGASVTIDWGISKVQKITLAHNVNFTFSGGADGDRLVLRIKQDGTGHWVPVWPANIRYGLDIVSIALTETPGHGDYLGFNFDGQDSKYDLVAHVKGYGTYGS